MKIIETLSNQYVIRRGNKVSKYQYADLKHRGYWWDLHSTNYKDCLTRMKREAEEYIEQRTFKE